MRCRVVCASLAGSFVLTEEQQIFDASWCCVGGCSRNGAPKRAHEEVRAVGSNLGEASHGNFSSNIRDWWLPRWLVRFRGELVGGAVLTAQLVCSQLWHSFEAVLFGAAAVHGLVAHLK